MGTLKFGSGITLETLTHTDTGLDNDIELFHVKNLTLLVNSIIMPIINQFGKDHVLITSAYRSDMVNHLVGGVVGSKHLEGKACDIVFQGIDFDSTVEWVKKNVKFNYLKTYPDNRIHIQLT